jgi:hypothetical protein
VDLAGSVVNLSTVGDIVVRRQPDHDRAEATVVKGDLEFSGAIKFASINA